MAFLLQSKAGTPTLSEDQQMASWAWSLALRLCLHSSMLPGCPIDVSAVPDVQAEARWQPIQQGVTDNYALSAYLALVMSKHSHM